MRLLTCHAAIFWQLIALVFAIPSARQNIRSYVAVGDSYPAGDGAGTSRLFPGLDVTCGRFSKAYPVVLAEALGLNGKWFSFYNAACGGATTQSVIWHQLRHTWNADLITIEVGGNEVNFFPVVNECIEQWHPFSSCDRELEKSRRLIQSTKFIAGFDRLIERAISWKRKDAELFVLGYARFFNSETEQCNNASFSLTNPANILSNELRESLNQLVLMLNAVVRAATEAHGAVYVDVDEAFKGHRFCEEGVTEPHPDWDGTWFFRERQDRRSFTATGEDETFEQEGIFINIKGPLGRYGDLTRTFHPTVQGHEAIAKKISEVLGH